MHQNCEAQNTFATITFVCVLLIWKFRNMAMTTAPLIYTWPIGCCSHHNSALHATTYVSSASLVLCICQHHVVTIPPFDAQAILAKRRLLPPSGEGNRIEISHKQPKSSLGPPPLACLYKHLSHLRPEVASHVARLQNCSLPICQGIPLSLTNPVSTFRAPVHFCKTEGPN
jgi:hypothetical protein